MQEPLITLKKVCVHNLKEVDLTLKHNELIVFTGVSGSGKSSLAFDTIYTEGQRRYVESLSVHARRQLEDLPKPDAELISGISPTIAIEQKSAGKNPRSTVGTMTGIYDFMRVLFAKVGTPHCPISGEIVKPQSLQHILHRLRALPQETRLIILAPFARGKKGEFKEDFLDLARKGYTKVRLDGGVIDLSEAPRIDGKVAHDLDIVVDRLSVQEDNRLAEAVSQALDLGEGVMSILNADTQEEELFSTHAYSPQSGHSYPPLESSDFSFNHPSGMCSSCQGLGMTQEFDLEKVIDPEKSIEEDCCQVASSYTTVRYGNIYNNLARLYDFKTATPWKKLSESAKNVFLYGTQKKWIQMEFVHPIKRSRWTEYVSWKGVLHEAKERFNNASHEGYKEHMKKLMRESVCPACCGERIRPYPAATTIEGKRIAEITSMPIDEALVFFDKLSFPPEQQKIAQELLKEISERLRFLTGVGLDYLCLDRSSPTLSGGESQRVRLASQIGSGLVGATYVLDEPSIGLHPRDNTKLLNSLKALRDRGNTVIVVEHDEETILAADTVVDVGPLAGSLGGRIVAQGGLQDILNAPESITGAYLSGKKEIPIPKRRKKKTSLEIIGAAHHNLRKVDVEIPLGLFVAVTGVSGSGKSSLISDTLYPALANLLQGADLSVGAYKTIKGMDALEKVIAIDQAPIGKTPRSNPATFTKVFDAIRDLFAQLPQSVASGYSASRFSFNVKEGSCPHCTGMGMLRIDMDFLEDEWIACPHCKGERFDSNTLSILYRGKSIHDVLEMQVDAALEFFSAIPSIYRPLQTLSEVGLGYIKLGQPSPTLSGGEAQRIKLAKELSRPSRKNTLYILDEPTTGLHFHDIHKLVDVLHRLVESGSSVLVIEHNMDLVKTADWILELGPEGGKGGGLLLASGTPEQIVKKGTATGLALKPYLHRTPFVPMQRMDNTGRAASHICVEGACQNNLKSVNALIPRGKITLCTGPSGSGKSSFAFETIYAEGQRRYIESMSPYARQFVKQMQKPQVERIEGLSPAIAIEQKNHAGNPRSTIGTMTETYDFLRLVYAHLGTAHCPETKEPLQTISKSFVVDQLLQLPEGTKLHILSPVELKRSESFEGLKERLQRQGFLRIRLNGVYYELDGNIPFDKQKKNALFLVIDRLLVAAANRKRLLEAIDQATTLSQGSCLAALENQDLFFNLSFASRGTGKSYPPLTPHTFSFNTQQGMCLDCQGLGFLFGADLATNEEILSMRPLELMQLLWKESSSQEAKELFLGLLKAKGISPKLPMETLSSEELQFLFNGSEETLSFEQMRCKWIGFNPVLAALSKSSQAEVKQELLPLFHQNQCPSCQGTRLNPLARHVLIQGKSIADACALSIDNLAGFIERLDLTEEKSVLLKEPIEELKRRLRFLLEIGIGYLSLDRSAPTLSGGETQRIRLARQLGSGLTGCLYVLDEPTIGLHPYDNQKLNTALKTLSALGNTLLLVEHDPLTIALADYIIDFGPAAGIHGGRITAVGSLEEIKNNPESLTGAYLSGRKSIPLPQTRRKGSGSLTLNAATLHNLHNITLDIPLKALTCLTGVSGSGKSTLLCDLLLPAAALALKGKKRRARGEPRISYLGSTLEGMQHFDQLLNLDQNPIGQTSRADISTYTDLLTPLRGFFASLPEATIRGLLPKNFSFNHPKGMCTACMGLGIRTISLQFLPPVKVTCESCQGFRLNPLSLKVLSKGRHLGHVLHMTVEEALAFLPPIPKVVRILDTLIRVGLGYLKLGQEINTLSGGEAQRLRLASELSRRMPGRTLYLLDEPTTGLHAHDIANLLPIFHSLVDQGNTVIVIEHNLDVIASSDHLIDIGPGSGSEGGHIVAQGTPEELALHSSSKTAHYLREYLRRC